MRVIYLHQYFNTPRMPGGTRSYEMARRLVEWGHEVQMVTSRLDENYSDSGWYQTDEDGIAVHWLPVPYSNKMSYPERIRAFFRFAFASSRKAASLDGDIVFATSTPLTIAIPGLYASRRKRIPMVFEVRDLWPEAPIQMGALTSKPLIALARRLEREAYRGAAHIVALTPGMRDGVLAAGVPPERVTVIPNSSDLHLFSPEVDGSEFRERLGLNGKFMCSYFGAMGRANGLDFVLDAAAELRRRGVDDVALVLHGDGSERERLEARKAQEGLNNVVFSNQVPDKRDIAKLAAASDACMTIYANVPILYTCSPNKMFDSLAAGRPVIVNMPGWLQGLVEENRAGVFVQPDNAVDFADKIQHLKANPQLREEYGKNARKLAERLFARDLLAKELEQVLLRTCGG